MRTDDDLRRILSRIDGRGYPAYKDLRGAYAFPRYDLYIDHVQGDPFAAPSRLRVRVPLREVGLPDWATSSPSRRVALRDWVARRFAAAIRRYSKGSRGSGKSGRIGIDVPGQEILDRSAVLLDGRALEVRFTVGLPAAGRRILGREAEAIFFQELPRIVEAACLFRSWNAVALRKHLETAEDADALRAQLRERGLVAFVADGSVLPRRSGVDDRPLEGPGVVPFESPPSLRVTLEAPNAGPVTGLGIPEGVTLIVGGGYHGKSTLLNALKRGIYNHIPGDGRERVVTDPDAVAVRAEDGRRVEKVDISPFINNLPQGLDTRRFSTDNASGSTSQAANIVEALEAGARVLLLDEDTSATNFMIRDRRMQALIAKDHEPITPFIDAVRVLYRDLGVSTVVVIGGSGDYFDVADTVLGMIEYRPHDLTREAKEIAARFPTGRRAEGLERFPELARRVPDPASIDPSKGRRAAKIKVREADEIAFGVHEIDLSAVEQLVDPSQTRAVAQALWRAVELGILDGRRTVAEVVREVDRLWREKGWDALAGGHPGNLAQFRPLELAAALNRLRTLRIL